MTIGSVSLDIEANIAGLLAQITTGIAGISGVVDIAGDVTPLLADVGAATSGIEAMVDIALDEQSRARLLAEASALSDAIPDATIDINASGLELAGLVGELSAAVDAAERTVADIDVPVGLDRSSVAALSGVLAAAVEGVEASAPEIDLSVGVDASSVAASAGLVGSSGAWRTAGLGAAALFGGGLLAAGAVGGFGVQLAAEAEQTSVAFETILGSAEAAEAQLTELRDFAAATPFEFPELATAASRLLAVGTEADSVIPIMTRLGDATSAMGTGSEGIQRAVTALTQIQQKGKVSAEELLQLTEAGIPAWDALAAQIGVSVPEAFELVKDGAVQARDVFAALESGAGESLQRLEGGMERQAQTLGGLFSTLKDTVGLGLTKAIEPVLPALKDAIGAVTPLIGDVVGPLGEAFAGVLAGVDFEAVFGGAVELFGRFFPALVDVAGAVGSVVEALAPLGAVAAVVLPPLLSGLASVVDFLAPIAPVVAAVAVGFAAFGAVPGILAAVGSALAFVVANPVVIGIAAVAAGFALAYRRIEPFREAVQQFASFITDTALPAIQDFAVFVGDKLGDAFDAFKVGDIAGAFDAFGDIGSVIVDGLGSALTAVGGWLTGTAFPFLAANAPGWIAALLGWIGDAVTFIVPRLAQLQIAIGGWIVGTAIPWLAARALDLAGALVGFVGTAVGLLPGALGALLGALGGFVTGTLLPAVGALFTQVIPFALGWIAGAAVRLPVELAKLWVGVQTWILFDLIPGIVGWVAGAVPAFLGWVGATVVKLPGALAAVGGLVGDFLGSLPGLITRGVAGLGDLLVDVGADVIRGLWRGMGDMVGWLVDQIGGLAGSVIDGFKSAFGIGSPSRLMADEIGQWIPPGLAQGITAAAGVAIAAASALSADVVAAATVAAAPVTIPVAYEATGTPVASAQVQPAEVLAADRDIEYRLVGDLTVDLDGRVVGETVIDHVIEERKVVR